VWLKEKDDHSVKPGDLRFLTSDGKDRRNGNHTRPNWVSMRGALNGQEVSLVAFCSPQNFRAPQHVRIHPNKSYFCFAPMVERPSAISPGEKYTSRYRFLVTSKAADPQRIAKHWLQYFENSK
jgi:Methane oxygenase PmoA